MKRSLSKSKKKTVLITGANGFIGGHLNDALSAKYDLVNLVFGQRAGGLKNCHHIDLRDKKRSAELFLKIAGEHNIFAILHLSSMLVSGTNASDISVLTDNIKITGSLIEAVRVLKPKKLIHFSSIALYPNNDGRYSEESAVRPQANSECLYGISKFCAESMFDFFLKGLNVGVVNLRLAQVYGKGMREDRIIAMMRRELEEKNAIAVYGGGRRVSNFVSVSRVVKAIEYMLAHNECGLFNLTGRQVSYLGLAKEIIRVFGNKESRVIIKPQGVRAKVYVDGRKIEKLIGRPRGEFDLGELR